MKILILISFLSLSFFHMEAQTSTVTLDSTNLPLFLINTNDYPIPDEPKITANLKIIFNENKKNKPTDAANIYDGKVGIEIRGKYSASLPQKPYGFETRDLSGVSKDVPLLNLPPDNDWILLANYNDKAFMRNTLALQIFRNLGHYAPRTRHCEVILNNSYDGIYVFTEKIKRGRNRVDINKLELTDNSGENVTGGYIFAVDYYNDYNSWTGQYPPLGYPGKYVHFVYNYPDLDVITSDQKSYLWNYISSFEKVLYGSNFTNPVTGYRAYIDVNSFIDYFIVSELSRNVDAYKKSCFYNKANIVRGGLISAGPVWDFDWAWKDIWDCSIFTKTDGSGWAYKVLECNVWPTPTGWVPRLMQDPLFVNQLRDRYTKLRNNVLSNFTLNNYVDSVANQLSEAQLRHYKRWPILGMDSGAPEVEPPSNTYAEEVTRLKDWISRRLNWLDAQMLTTSETELHNTLQDHYCRVFPNPAHDELRFETAKPIHEITIYNLSGKQVLQRIGLNTNTIPMDISHFAPGLYLAKLRLESDEYLLVRFVKE
jgi:hypothetical protein